jgi:hypothetical protein
MSNRWKRRKARAARQAVGWGEAEERLTVTTAAGRYSGQPAGERGWMKLEGFRPAPGAADGPAGPMLASACCPKSGEQYVKPLTGRYRDLPEGELRKRRDELVSFLNRLGMCWVADGAGPLWMLVEHLEAIVEFEVEPPCGCCQPGAAAC